MCKGPVEPGSDRRDTAGFNADSPDEHINIDLCSSGKSVLKPPLPICFVLVVIQSASIRVHLRLRKV